MREPEKHGRITGHQRDDGVSPIRPEMDWKYSEAIEASSATKKRNT